MSRVANTPVVVPDGVEVKLSGRELAVTGSLGELRMTIDAGVEVNHEGQVLTFSSTSRDSTAMSGTTRALVNNMVIGVTAGFEKKLQLDGVGYRVSVSGGKVNLALGFSHPVIYQVPEGIKVTTPSQNEIVVRGLDKQAVGQAAAELRAFRPPEQYKGKGIRYQDERVRRKEAKKK